MASVAGFLGRMAGALWVAALCGAQGRALAGAAGAPPSYGHDFVTVGAPGNRAALESERYYGSAVTGFPNLGAVNYEFRINRTETTATQWRDFVQAAWPVALQQGYSNNDPRLTGIYAYTNGNGPSAQWLLTPGTEQLAVGVSFRFAAWYCNWLEHGRPTDPGAITLETFTTGAYTVGANSIARNPGAQYWVPTLDEWTKATYYDPNRYGVGQEGYWLYPGMSMVPLIGGPPGTPGAQTSAGSWHQGQGLPPDVGSYPDVQSPWGLLDTSGGVSEWVDAPYQGLNQLRHYRGEGLGGGEDKFFDLNDYLFLGRNVDLGGNGFRIASAIPSPNTCIPLVIGCVPMGRRRR